MLQVQDMPQGQFLFLHFIATLLSPETTDAPKVFMLLLFLIFISFFTMPLLAGVAVIEDFKRDICKRQNCLRYKNFPIIFHH